MPFLPIYVLPYTPVLTPPGALHFAKNLQKDFSYNLSIYAWKKTILGAWRRGERLLEGGGVLNRGYTVFVVCKVFFIWHHVMLLSVFAAACLELHRLPQFDEIKAIFNLFLFSLSFGQWYGIVSIVNVQHYYLKAIHFLYCRHFVCLIGWINVYYGVIYYCFFFLNAQSNTCVARDVIPVHSDRGNGIIS